MDMKTKRALAPALAPALIAGLLAGAMVLSGPAGAADMKGGAGPRVVGSYPAVPVPAPIPVPEAFNWYVRADAGYTFAGDKPSYQESGYTTNGYASAGSSEQSSRWDNNGSFGVGVGYVFNRWLRGDITFETRGKTERRYSASQTYDVSAQLAPLPVPSNRIQVDTDDTLKTRAWLGLVNAYVDIPTGWRFTPYVGAGIGIVDHRIGRYFGETHSDVTAAAFNSTGGFDCGTAGGGAAAACPSILAAAASGSARNNTNSTGFAWALMAGGAFEVHSGVLVDVGYRYLHLDGGNIAITRPNVTAVNPLLQGGGTTSLSFGDYSIHEVRAGLRYNIW
jgi:opacity protein-like surface antigen